MHVNKLGNGLNPYFSRKGTMCVSVCVGGWSLEFPSHPEFLPESASPPPPELSLLLQKKKFVHGILHLYLKHPQHFIT